MRSRLNKNGLLEQRGRTNDPKVREAGGAGEHDTRIGVKVGMEGIHHLLCISRIR